MGCTKNGFKRDVYSNKILPQEIRKIINNLILHLKQLEKNKQNQKLVERKEIRKMRAEIEMKETIEKTHEPKS